MMAHDKRGAVLSSTLASASMTISASGKTKRVAFTQGNVSVKDSNGVEVKIGLNVYVKPAD